MKLDSISEVEEYPTNELTIITCLLSLSLDRPTRQSCLLFGNVSLTGIVYPSETFRNEDERDIFFENVRKRAEEMEIEVMVFPYEFEEFLPILTREKVQGGGGGDPSKGSDSDFCSPPFQGEVRFVENYQQAFEVVFMEEDFFTNE